MTNTETGKSVLEEKLSPSLRRWWMRFYPGHNPSRLRELLFQNIRTSDHVLEIGAGSGRGNQNRFEIRNRVARYVGVDPVASVLTNPYLDEAYQCKANSLPFADASFDLVFHCFVAEHFESPPPTIERSRGFLNPVGSCCFRRRAAATTRCWPLK
jgi:ubiquinone/menaquinone biosynthesis C-methylase UbiE